MEQFLQEKVTLQHPLNDEIVIISTYFFLSRFKVLVTSSSLFLHVVVHLMTFLFLYAQLDQLG